MWKPWPLESSDGAGDPEAMDQPVVGTQLRKKRVISAVFILLLLVWPVQYLFSDLVVEPWPAMMMPRFTHLGASIKPNDKYNLPVEIVAYTRSGDSVAVPEEELMRGLPRGHYDTVMRFQFTPAPDSTFLTRQFLLDRLPALEWLITHYPLNNYFEPRLNYPLGNSPQTRHWLRGQLAQFQPDQEFERLEFTWFKVPVAVSDGQLVYGEKEEIRSYVVQLH